MHFQTVFERSNDMILVIELERDRILDANPRACAVLGYSQRELLALPISEIHPHEMPALRDFAHVVSRKGGSRTDQLTCRTKTGKFVPAEISASFADIDGRSCLICFIHDISERKQKNERIQGLSDIFAENPCPVLRVRRDCTVFYANSAALPLLGHWSHDADCAIPSAFQPFIERAFSSNLSQEFDLEFNKQMFRFDLIPVPTADYVNIYGQNITRLKRMEAGQRASYDLLHAITRVQSRYIANANTYAVFGELLDSVLLLTQSEYGFIGEVSPEQEGECCLRIRAIANAASNKQARKVRSKYEIFEMESHDMDALFGKVAATGKPVIFNNSSGDSLDVELPKGHHPLKSFLGTPFYFGSTMFGMIGIANRADGYDEAMVEYLQPALGACAHIFNALRKEEKSRKAGEAPQDAVTLTSRERQMLSQVAAGATNQQIADKLCLSVSTVKAHIYNSFKKIDVSTRLQAALWAANNL